MHKSNPFRTHTNENTKMEFIRENYLRENQFFSYTYSYPNKYNLIKSNQQQQQQQLSYKFNKETKRS